MTSVLSNTIKKPMVQVSQESVVNRGSDKVLSPDVVVSPHSSTEGTKTSTLKKVNKPYLYKSSVCETLHHAMSESMTAPLHSDLVHYRKDMVLSMENGQLIETKVKNNHEHGKCATSINSPNRMRLHRSHFKNVKRKMSKNLTTRETF
jgi:hypothetical protein